MSNDTKRLNRANNVQSIKIWCHITSKVSMGFSVSSRACGKLSEKNVRICGNCQIMVLSKAVDKCQNRM